MAGDGFVYEVVSPVGEYVGAPAAVGIGALVCLAYGILVMWRFPSVRRME